MKYVNWNRTRALAAVCAMVILLSATGLTAFADNAEANQADLQQVMRMGPQGRNKMQGGPRQDEQHMPFGKQDGDFAPPADGDQPPESQRARTADCWSCRSERRRKDHHLQPHTAVL